MVQVAGAAKLSAGLVVGPEWWERFRDRLAGWMVLHPVLSGRVRLAWLGGCLLGLAVFGVLALLFPNLRAAAGVYVGVGWILLCWVLLARTRTLTLGGVSLLYGVCLPWSLVIGVVSLHLSALMPESWPLRGPGTLGPAIGIAAVTEEAFKLVPVTVLVVLAPGRVRRFAAVDWLLVGLASGAAFLTSEEVQRRLGMLRPGSRGLLDFCTGGSADQRIDCYGLTQFGLNPFGTKTAVTGLFGTDPTGAQYAGHHVLTALVTVGVGLGIVVWRSAGATWAARTRRRVLAVVLPVAMFWVAVGDHVVLNAEAQLGGLTGSGGRWLESNSTIPAAFRLWWYLGGHGHGRTGLLVVLLVVAMLCDASRARRRDYWSIALSAGPVWADRAIGWVRTRLGDAEATGPARYVRDGVVSVGVAGAGLAYLMTRDLRLTLAAHARHREESRRDAMLRGRAALMMQREAREIAADVDAGPGGRHRYRLVALVALAALLVLGLVAGPALARSIGWDVTFSSRWLAGLAEDLGKWWHTLTPGQQLALTALAALALAIPLGFGWGLFLAGGLSYLAAHGRGAGALLRDPRRATREYLTHRSLGGMALDAGEFALTFVPAGLGSAGGVAAKGAIRELADDHRAYLEAWRLARRGHYMQHPERGAVDLDALGRLLVNGRQPINGSRWAGKVFADERRWTAALQSKYPQGVRFSAEGFPDFTPYATHTYLFEHGFTGDRAKDFRLADKAMGWTKRPDGYTWHHAEDGRTLQLIPRDLHLAVRHTGGHAVIKPPK